MKDWGEKRKKSYEKEIQRRTGNRFTKKKMGKRGRTIKREREGEIFGKKKREREREKKKRRKKTREEILLRA